MGFTLTVSQERASKAIKHRVVKALNGDQDKKHTTLYAMGGAGKTIIISETIPGIIDEYGGDVCFMWISPGDGEVHKQSFDKLQQNLRQDIKCTLIDKTIRGKSYISKNEVGVVNWEKIRSEKINLLLQDGDYIGFPSICENTKERNKLVLIIDESHKNQTDNTAKSIDTIDPDVIVRMSATPLEKPDVKISSKELKDEQVIKKCIEVNLGVTEFKEKNPDMNNLRVVLNCAYELRERIKESLGSDINPLILCQVANGNKKQIEEVKDFFMSKDIGEPYENLAVWVSKSQNKNVIDETITTPGFDKEEVKFDDSKINVLIFKQAISTGWDCPRAYIWIKLRDNMETRFEIQTVYRINRQPNRKYFDDDLLNTGYVFTDDDNFEVKNNEYESPYINWLPARLKDGIELTLENYYRKWDAREIKLESAEDSIGFHKVLTEIFNNEFGIVDKDDVYTNMDLLKAKGYDPSARILSSDMLGDSTIDSEDIAKGEFKAAGSRLHGYASNTQIISRFEELILDTMSKCDIAKNSFVNVNNALKRWAVDYLGFNQKSHLDKLYSFFIRNWSNFSEVLSRAVDVYKVGRLEDKQRKLQIKPEKEDWVLKSWDQFNDVTFEEVQYNKYAYDKCYLRKGRSEVEKVFEGYLDVHNGVDWWQKNKDSGRENFSIPYEYNGEYHLFYVDFISKMKNGTIFIADTKEDKRELDSVGIAKSLGLQKYIEDQNTKGIKMVGGIVKRNKFGNMKIWTRKGPYKLSGTLDDWESFDTFLSNNAK